MATAADAGTKLKLRVVSAYATPIVHNGPGVRPHVREHKGQCGRCWRHRGTLAWYSYPQAGGTRPVSLRAAEPTRKNAPTGRVQVPYPDEGPERRTPSEAP